MTHPLSCAHRERVERDTPIDASMRDRGPCVDKKCTTRLTELPSSIAVLRLSRGIRLKIVIIHIPNCDFLSRELTLELQRVLEID